jgi:ABC-2 type transport system permease protein
MSVVASRTSGGLVPAYRSELRKLWTVRTVWVLTAVGWGLVALSTSAGLFSALVSEPFTGTSREVAEAVDQVGASAMLVLIVALLAMTTEFRHGTIGRTLQITPSRTGVLAAKLAAGATYALAYFLSALLIVALLVGMAGVVHGVTPSLGSEVATALWQGPVALVLNAVLGIAVGALLRSQVVAISVTLVWLFLVENLVAALRPELGRWLPFQALSSLFIAQDQLPAAPDAGVALLEPPVALAVFLGYVLAASAAAVVLLRTRDV